MNVLRVFVSYMLLHKLHTSFIVLGFSHGILQSGFTSEEEEGVGEVEEGEVGEAGVEVHHQVVVQELEGVELGQGAGLGKGAGLGQMVEVEHWNLKGKVRNYYLMTSHENIS